MNADTPHFLVGAASRTLYVGSGFHVTAFTDGMFLVISNIEIDAQRMQSIGQGRQSAIPDADDRVLNAVDSNDTSKLPFGGRRVLSWCHCLRRLAS